MAHAVFSIKPLSKTSKQFPHLLRHVSISVFFLKYTLQSSQLRRLASDFVKRSDKQERAQGAVLSLPGSDPNRICAVSSPL
jgi:hypothetical protein